MLQAAKGRLGELWNTKSALRPQMAHKKEKAKSGKYQCMAIFFLNIKPLKKNVYFTGGGGGTTGSKMY